jgi:hypothetical protein
VLTFEAAMLEADPNPISNDDISGLSGIKIKLHTSLAASMASSSSSSSSSSGIRASDGEADGEGSLPAASAAAGTVTYTANNYFVAGNTVSIYGLSTSAFNLTNVTVASASTTQFTVTNAATGTAVSSSTSGRAFKKATDGDTRLGFEFYRLPIQLASTDIQTSAGTTTYSVVYKTTIPQDVSATISEIGLYPSARSSVNNFDSKYLADFNDAFDWTDENGDHPSVLTTGQKIGDNVIELESNGTSAMIYTQNINPIDFSGYSVNDSITFAYNKPEADVLSIKIRFYSEATKYYEVTITPQTGLGYKIVPDILMSTVFAGAVNSPDKTNITQIGVIVTPNSSKYTIPNPYLLPDLYTELFTSVTPAEDVLKLFDPVTVNSEPP